MKKVRHAKLRQTLVAASVAACFSFPSEQAWSNPTGPSVASGSATFTTAGSTLVINNSANAIINWQGFSIGINEITRFLQSSAGSAVLNRVVGANGVIPQSVIDGVLQSNGRVFLLNPMGVVIGQSARIDVAGLVASSLNLSDADFLAGKMRFTEVPGAGGIVNQGSITTSSGGKVYLVAPDVQNTGIITAPQGEIVLAAGKSAELVSESSPFVTVKITADSQQALNVGSLIADAGSIGMYGALVRNSGVAEASGAVAGPGGQIRFVAAKDLTLDAGSRTAANGTSGGDIVLQAQGGTNTISGTVEAIGSSGQGGSVQALGVRVGVIGHGVIDASGDTGGGTVLVGGDAHGANPDVQNSQQTFIGLDGIIRADAGTSGNGGKVVVWSDGDTGFYGGVSARGGSRSGNGGFVETSGKGSLQALGHVDVRAPNGRDGGWLLDPTDITIVTSGDNGADFYVAANGGLFEPNSAGAPSPSIVTAGAINGFAGDVTLQATHDVTFQADINKGNGGLTAQAGHDINLGTHNITVSGGVTLSANDSNLTPSGGSILSSGGGGNISAGSGSGVLLNGVNVTVGNIRTDAGSNPNFTAVTIGASTGAVTTGSIVTGNATADSAVTISAGGSVTTGSITTGTSGGGMVNSIVGITGSSVSTGDITTHASPDTHVQIYAVGGTITTGSITTADSSGSSWVELYGNPTTITVNGSILTGNSPYSAVEITGFSTLAKVTGSIKTGDGAEGAVSIFGSGMVQTGSISTGNSTSSPSGLSYVDISTNGPVTTGPITTGNAGQSGFVSIDTNGSIQTGPITTGNAGFDSGVYLSSFSSSVTVNGDIQTGSSGDYSMVQLHAYGGTVKAGNIRVGDGVEGIVDIIGSTGIQTGSITTGSSTYSFVKLNSPSSITTGDIRTGDGGEGTVQIIGGLGAVQTGSITTGTSSGDSYVQIANATGAIQTGPITTGTSNFGDSSVQISGSSGPVQTGSITTGSAAYGSSTVSIFSNGTLNTGDIQTGNSAAGYGGNTYISLFGAGSVTTGNLTTGAATACCSSSSQISVSSAHGGVSVGNAQTGDSFDRFVSYYAGGGDVVSGAIITRSSNPQFNGGFVQLDSEVGRIVVNGDIDTRGADGNASSPSGSSGGDVFILRLPSAAAPASGNAVAINGSILTSGGNAATTSAGFGGWGGSAGMVSIGASFGSDGGEGGLVLPLELNGAIKVAGQIIAKGGNGASSTLAAYGGGWGGSGGGVLMSATDSVFVGPTPKFNVFPTAIDTSGGNAGNGGPGGPGGQGGMAGTIAVDPATITISGTVLGLGGAGGSGTIGGNGGAGAILNFQTPNGVVTFLNGGFDVTGGLGGSPGGLAGLTTAPVINGTLVFAFVTNPDVFTIPEVAASISSTINTILTSTKSNDSQTNDDSGTGTGNKKDKTIGSCKG